MLGTQLNRKAGKMKRISCVLLACAFAMGLSATSAAAAERFETEIVFVDGSGGASGFL